MQWHFAAIALIPALVIVTLTLYDRARYRRLVSRLPATASVTAPRHNRRPVRLSGKWYDPLLLSGWASASAGVIHGGVFAAHDVEDHVCGAFFLLLLVLQLGWSALVLTRATVQLLRTGAAMNVGIVALWAYSRTFGLPFGPNAGLTEGIGPLDVVATLLELGIVILALGLTPGPWNGGPTTASSATPAHGSPPLPATAPWTACATPRCRPPSSRRFT